MVKEFCCNGRQLADYLVKNGFGIIRTEFIKGRKTYVFEYDESIDKRLEQWEVAKKRSLF